MADIILTGLLLAVWLPGVAWAFAWWDVKKRATAQSGVVLADALHAIELRLEAALKLRDEAIERRFRVLEQNLREAGLNPKTPLSKQSDIMPFGRVRR